MNPQVRRLALDLGPLLIFFAAFRYLGIFGATACFMVAIAVALALGYFLERRVSPMPLFTAILVMVFGGLTLYLKNDVFIRISVGGPDKEDAMISRCKALAEKVLSHL